MGGLKQLCKHIECCTDTQKACHSTSTITVHDEGGSDLVAAGQECLGQSSAEVCSQLNHLTSASAASTTSHCRVNVAADVARSCLCLKTKHNNLCSIPCCTHYCNSITKADACTRVANGTPVSYVMGYAAAGQQRGVHQSWRNPLRTNNPVHSARVRRNVALRHEWQVRAARPAAKRQCQYERPQQTEAHVFWLLWVLCE